MLLNFMGIVANLLPLVLSECTRDFFLTQTNRNFYIWKEFSKPVENCINTYATVM